MLGTGALALSGCDGLVLREVQGQYFTREAVDGQADDDPAAHQTWTPQMCILVRLCFSVPHLMRTCYSLFFYAASFLALFLGARARDRPLDAEMREHNYCPTPRHDAFDESLIGYHEPAELAACVAELAGLGAVLTPRRPPIPRYPVPVVTRYTEALPHTEPPGKGAPWRRRAVRWV